MVRLNLAGFSPIEPNNFFPGTLIIAMEDREIFNIFKLIFPLELRRI